MKIKSIKIKTPKGERLIGHGQPVFIIAEAGANWHISNNIEKNKKQAFKLIDIAVAAGADAVKFQLYIAARLYPKQAGYADYLGKKESIYNIIRDRELPSAWLSELKRYCDKQGIVFLCTPFDEKSVDDLEKIDIAVYKIASYEISHLPLIKYIAAKKKPIFFSTGAADLKDVAREAKIIKDAGNKEYAILQCTAKYPAPLSTINLQVIPELIKKFNVPVGLSDHSRESAVAPLGAVALGAKIIEKHFTTDNNLSGPDHIFSVLPLELADMVQQIRMLELTLGVKSKNVQEEERELFSFCRRALYAKINIKRGELFSRQNIIVLRPGQNKKGLMAEDWDKVAGRLASKDIESGLPITKNSVGN